MFNSKVFSTWFVLALLAWLFLFSAFAGFVILKASWYYPAVMVLGAFVAGLTPQGGGAVAFPALNIFLHIDRVLARDFSMMIQSIGMTSASIFILSRKGTVLKDFKPLLTCVPVCFAGFITGMLTLQAMPVFLIQAFFLSLSATFVIAYYVSSHRGSEDRLLVPAHLDALWLGLTLFIGGMITSLFGTGADVLLYTLLITHFGMKEKSATYISIILQAAISVLGYGYRAFINHDLTHYQIQTWLCAYPVVLFMAPFGAYILSKIHVDWMLIAIIVLNIFQMIYFIVIDPSVEKTVTSAALCLVLGCIFLLLLRHMNARRSAQENR